MFGHHFIYDNHSSEEFKLFTASFNQSTDIPLALSRNVLRGEINRYRSNPYHMGTNWDNTLSFTMDLIKDPCSDINDIYFTEDETDDIMAWLTSPDYPILFHMYDYDDAIVVDEEKFPQYRKYDYYGVFTTIEPNIINGKIAGFSCTFTTNSPFAWTEEKSATLVPNENGETEMSIFVNHSERYREVYPIIEINPDNGSGSLDRVKIAKLSIRSTLRRNAYAINDLMAMSKEQIKERYVLESDEEIDEIYNLIREVNETGDYSSIVVDYEDESGDTRSKIKISNLTDNGKVMVLTIPKMITYIDCSRSMIYDETGLVNLEDIGVDDVGYIYFPKFYHGENRIYVQGKATVTFRWREARKVGAY